MRSALKLLETSVPASFYTEIDDHGQPFAPITAIAETFQQGVAIAEPIVVEATSDTALGSFLSLVNGAATVAGGAAADPSYGYLIYAAALRASVLAAPRDVVLFAIPLLQTPADIGLRMAKVTLTTGGSASWMDFEGTSTKPMFIPPGFTPVLIGSGFVFPETFTVQASVARVAAGWKAY